MLKINIGDIFTCMADKPTIKYKITAITSDKVYITWYSHSRGRQDGSFIPLTRFVSNFNDGFVILVKKKPCILIKR